MLQRAALAPLRAERAEAAVYPRPGSAARQGSPAAGMCPALRAGRASVPWDGYVLVPARATSATDGAGARAAARLRATVFSWSATRGARPRPGGAPGDSTLRAHSPVSVGWLALVREGRAPALRHGYVSFLWRAPYWRRAP